LAGRASAKDVGALTLFFKKVVSEFFPDPCTGDDLVFRELLVTVWNRILLRLKDLDVSEKEAEEIGFMLRRVWFTMQAYRARKENRSWDEWLDLVKGIARKCGIQI